jgi:hypothetical protein
MANAEEIVVRDYRRLMEVLNARRKKLNMPMLAVDDASSLQTGYSAKLFAGIRNLGPLSLGMLLAALDVELVVRPRNSENERDQAA